MATRSVLNINAAVRVTLTAAGLRWYHEFHDRLGLRPREFPGDPAGEFTLWQLMQIFGPHISPGIPEGPFVDNRIEVIDPRV